MIEYTVKVFEDRTEWYFNGLFHRTDGPAVERADGIKRWYFNGKLHRTDGPAVEDNTDGYKAWYFNGKLHRTDGPAIELAIGTKEWYLNNKLHRIDGPAIEYADGDKHWYLNGKKLTEEAFKKQVSVPTCNGKIVEIDGKKYKLQEV
jgi:antitoxin component YwqK of YwqJK toxin-antitoxin module